MTCDVCDSDRTARIVMTDPEFRRPWWSRVLYRGSHRRRWFPRRDPQQVWVGDLLTGSTTCEVTA